MRAAALLQLALMLALVAHSAGAVGTGAVSITNFSLAQSNVSANSTLSFVMRLQNSGALATSPINLTLSVAGAENSATTLYVAALVPGQSEVLFIFLRNQTGAAGAYTATARASYSFNGTRQLTNAVSASYNVSAQLSAYSLLPAPQQVVAPIPYISFTELPFFSSLQANRTVLPPQTLGIKNELSYEENISIMIPAIFSNILHFSETKTSIAPGQTALIGVSLSIPNTSAFTYSVPVSINVKSPAGVNVTGTEYFLYNVFSATQLSVLGQAWASYGNVTGTLAVFNPTGAQINNATLAKIIPPRVVTKASQIITFGREGSVSVNNGTATISWPIQSLPPGENIAFSFFLLNATDPGLLIQSQKILTVPSQPSPGSILKITKIEIPNFYTNSMHNVTVGLLYTGAAEQNVTLTLVSHAQIKVANPMQVVDAKPNMQFERNFSIAADNATGTFILTLNAATGGASINYTVPLVVLQAQAGTTSTLATTTAAQQQHGPGISTSSIEFAVAAIIGVILLLAVLSKLASLVSRAPSDRRQGETSDLKGLRERIRNSDKE
jgi:hypothetical protein